MTVSDNFHITPGVTYSQQQRSSPIQCFDQIFTPSVWQFIVDHTNSYAQHKIPSFTRQFSLYRNWVPITIEEMKAFTAVILNMGIIKLSKVEDYWRQDLQSRIPYFSSVFTRDRFFQIFGMLHVGEIDSSEKMEKITPFIDLLMPIIQSNYNPHQKISIDEFAIQFKGRTRYKQYLKGKPHPWGIKAYALSDGITGYMHNLRVYFGKQTSLVDRIELSHTVRVVITLCDHLKNSGYDLFTDRFYTSPLLADELTKIGITPTGTVMSNKKGLPTEVKSKNKMIRGTTNSYKCKNMTLIEWMDKRKILLLTTKYGNAMSEISSRLVLGDMAILLWYCGVRSHTVL